MVLLSKKDYDKMIDRLIKEGDEIRGTYEFIGRGLKTGLIKTSDVVSMFNLDMSVISTFVDAITTFKEMKVGPYDTSKYFLVIPDLKAALNHLKNDGVSSRRCVITFPPEHCFQSIQFLYRDNTVNVVCFMRSCDAIKNLPYDLWLCSFLAQLFASYIHGAGLGKPYPEHRITFSFGSLHIYRDDVL